MSSLILTKEECCEDRTPDQLYTWLFKKIDLFYSRSQDAPDLKKQLLLREGTAKQFYEEIYPLALFAKHYYAGRADISVKWVPGNQNHDAVIRGRDEEPLFVEIAQTVYAYEESLRMEYFLHKDREGLVSLTGKVKRDRAQKTGIAIDHGFIFAPKAKEGYDRVGDILRKKHEKSPCHYHSNTYLVVLVDDWVHFVDEDEWARLRTIAARNVCSPTWPFRRLFFVGISGEHFLGLSKEDVSSAPDETPESCRCDWAGS
jgi:hypothetical protein